VDTDVTTVDDPRITPLGRLFRAAKIDELPQLLNVLVGSMSFVGPRPDVPGYADQLAGGDRLLLTVRPGITGPATLKYRDEADLLAQQDDPERYNREIIYPDKVEINKAYILNWTLAQDIAYIIRTVFPS
jgi:lipopolysaccharide/colanic/teichoic acid biosynthesis glycosyltransferase